MRNMLGRVGKVDQSIWIYQKNAHLSIHFCIGALLSACRVYSKPKLGKVAAENLFQLDPNDSGNHVLLSNMLASLKGNKFSLNINRKWLPSRNELSWKLLFVASYFTFTKRTNCIGVNILMWLTCHSLNILRWKEADEVREEMKDVGINKGVGCSWINV